MSWRTYAVPLIVGIMVFLVMVSALDLMWGGRIRDLPRLPRIVLGVSLAALFAGVAFAEYRQRRRRAKHAEQALRKLRDAARPMNQGDLRLAVLWAETHARLDYYHDLMTGHAWQSHRNAQVATVGGFVVLLLFGVVAMQADRPEATIVASVLGGTSAALSGYISKTFVRSQEHAAERLRSYFDHPVKFSRYLAAVRLIDEMVKLKPEQRAAISGELLRTIVAPDATPGSGGGTPGSPVPSPRTSGENIPEGLGDYEKLLRRSP
jgi:hypothetical protein